MKTITGLTLLILALASDSRAETRAAALRESVSALQARLTALENEYGQERDRLARYLGYLDLTLGMQVAEGGMTEADAADWLRQRAQHLFANSYAEPEIEQVFQQWRQAAQGFLDRIERRASSGTTWPADASPAAYRELLLSHLGTQRSLLPDKPGAAIDAAAGILAVAEELRNWTHGRRQPGTLAEAANYFSASHARVDTLLQGQRDALLADAGGLENPAPPGSPPSFDPPQPGVTLEAAVAHLYANQIPEALQAFRDLRRTRSGEDEILRLWALTEIVANGDLPEARRVANELAARHAGDAQYIMLQGQAAFYSQDIETGIRLLSEAAKADPNLVQGMYQQANDMLSKGVPAVAYVQYSSLAYMQPPYAPAFYGLGFAAKALGYKEVAVEAFQTYLRHDSASVHAENVRKELEALGDP